MDHRRSQCRGRAGIGRLHPDRPHLQHVGHGIGHGRDQPVRIGCLGPTGEQADRRTRVGPETVDPAFDPRAQPGVRRMHGHRNDSHRQQAAHRAGADEPVGSEEQGGVEGHDSKDQEQIGQRARQDETDVEEPVPQDRDAHGDR